MVRRMSSPALPDPSGPVPPPPARPARAPRNRPLVAIQADPLPARRPHQEETPGEAMNLACVAHELRTPLTAIQGALDLLHSGALGALPETASRMIDIARDNSRRLLRLVEDILASGASGAGQFTMRWADVDLGTLLRDAVAAQGGLVADAASRFTIKETSAGAIVWGDRGRLHQVLANLLSNAVKFDPAGGAVALSLRRTESGFRITVTDQGPGIPPAFRPFLFRRFSRAAETAGAVPGSGLGLSIANAIVAQHGGTLSLDGTVTAGSSFHIDLPAPDSPEIHPM